MRGLIPWRKSRSGEREGALVPTSEVPFFMSQMRGEFDRLFDRLAQEFPMVANGKGWHWDVDVKDEENAVVVRAEAPGFEAGDFDIQVSEDRIVLRAAKKTEKKEKEGKYQETREQECYESMTLPAGIDKDKVEARYQSGVLTITLPKTAAAKGRRVPVKNA